MTEITLYKPGKKKLDITISIPSSWNELTRQELLLIMGDMKRLEEKGFHTKVNMLINLITLRAADQKIKLPKSWKEDLSGDDVATTGLPAIDFLVDSLELTNQQVPNIKNYYGPAKEFSDMRCGEFEDAEVFFNLYKISNEIKDLAMMTARLWRPLKNGKRILYSDYNFQKAEDFFLKVDPEILLANFFWFAGCLQLLPQFFPVTFSKSESEPDIAAFTKCIHAAAGVKNGTRPQIRETLVLEFFFELEQETIRSLREA